MPSMVLPPHEVIPTPAATDPTSPLPIPSNSDATSVQPMHYDRASFPPNPFLQ